MQRLERIISRKFFTFDYGVVLPQLDKFPKPIATYSIMVIEFKVMSSQSCPNLKNRN